MSISQPREEIDASIASGSVMAARLRLHELWRRESTAAGAAFVNSRFEKLRGQIPLVNHRLAILRSFTVEPAIALLRAEAFVHGIDLSIQLGDFNAYSQEILDSQSSLYSFAPDSVILAVQSRDLAPDLWQNYADLSQIQIKDAIQCVTTLFRSWFQSCRRHSQANLIVHGLEKPNFTSLGVLDAQSVNGQSAAIEEINKELRSIAGEFRGIYILDYDALVARHGRLAWGSEHKWLTARMPIAAGHLLHLAREWVRFLAPLSGRFAKVLVTDLDNTLWGGVIGEDGMSSIKLGAEYPGAIYQSVQRLLLNLSRRGILLAICSKNNPDDAMEVLDRHPGMLLRREHFAAVRINWNDKVQGLRELAAELNVGTDALAFLDDNPAERERVKAEMPEVTVLEVPQDPSQFAAVILDCPLFERLTVSSEDQQRSAIYAAQQQRSQAEQSFQSKEEFYEFLEQEAEIAPVQPMTLARVAQLTQKTNQFNVTTQRYTEQQISQMSARSDYDVLAIRVQDRYGDNGLVGVAITRTQRDECVIDTFLLSCRVIGRSVETAMLSEVASRARARGCKKLIGRFLPTKKNAPARDFFRQHGFTLRSQSEQESVWELDLERNAIACPTWIKLSATMEESLERRV